MVTPHSFGCPRDVFQPRRPGAKSHVAAVYARVGNDHVVDWAKLMALNLSTRQLQSPATPWRLRMRLPVRGFIHQSVRELGLYACKRSMLDMQVSVRA